MNQQQKTFEFSSYFFEKNEANFVYRILLQDNQSLTFTEKIQFSDFPKQEIPSQLLDNMLHALHLLLGISYWKLYCPQTIEIKTKPLTKEQAKFWNTVYTKGLGEFFYQNKIDGRGLINFAYEENAIATEAIAFPRSNRSLLGIGGGKDSIVAAEMLKKLNHEMTAYLMETQKPHDLSEQVVEVLEIGKIRVKRIIDAQLFDSNNLPGAYNGHIPISAVFAMVGIFTAILHNYKYVIVGNERSANSENLIWLDQEINHQWSKSAEFEQMLQEYTKNYITPDVTYFSLLRPLSEIQIVEKFAPLEKYFYTFSSCNRNFKVHKETGLGGKLWCGECPKCAFVWALMAAYLPKEKMVSIFGKNMYADESLIDLFKELLGLTGKKPFECVGTFEEMKVAMYMAYEKGEYNDNRVMRMFIEEVIPQLTNIEELTREVFVIGDMSLIPEEFRNVY